MARKNLIYSYKLFDNKVVTSNTMSSSTNVAQLDNASIDLRWNASTLVATVEVQAKNGVNSNWRTLDFGSPITITGSSGAHEILLLIMPFTDIRLVITVTSGSGNVDAVLTSKTVGA
jgi:hypothetical protein